MGPGEDSEPARWLLEAGAWQQSGTDTPARPLAEAGRGDLAAGSTTAVPAVPVAVAVAVEGLMDRRHAVLYCKLAAIVACIKWGGGRQLQPPPLGPLRRQWSVAEGLGTGTAGEEVVVGDKYKEAHRKKQRTVFNLVRWKQHRSSKRYWRHMLGGGQRVPDSECGSGGNSGAGLVAEYGVLGLPSMVRALAGPLLYVMVVATMVASYHALAEEGRVPQVWEGFNLGNNAALQLTSFALSLLLVFRYSRFLDARKAWGSVVNRSRDLARQALAYLPSPPPPPPLSPGHSAGPGGAEVRELQAMLCRWVAAFSYCLMGALREEGDEADTLHHLLPPHELTALLAADHRPYYVLQVLSSVIYRAQQQQQQQVAAAGQVAVAAQAQLVGLQLRMDANLTALEDAMGTCERILRTPIPLGYTRHTSRFLMIWLTLLPFTLWESCKWALLPMAFIISFLLLGIEEIGVQIEEPFSILPLCHICHTIERNVAELFTTHASTSHALVNDSSAASRGPSAACLVDAVLQQQYV